jgi:hypothetical protein
MKDYDYATIKSPFEIGDKVRVKETDITYIIEDIPEPNLYNSKSKNEDGLIYSFYGSELEKI